MLTTYSLLRPSDIFVRIVPASQFRLVRSRGRIAHYFIVRFVLIAPFAAKVAGRRVGNRRKYPKRAGPGAHYLKRVVRGRVGKRSDAHYEGSVVRSSVV